MKSQSSASNNASPHAMIVRVALLTAVLAVIASACQIPIGAGITVDKAVTGVVLNKETLSLTVGNSEKLAATMSPSNAANKAVSWKSSNAAAATVSSSGTVTAKAVGAAVITVTTLDGSFTDTCDVIVSSGSTTVPVTGVTLDIESKTIPYGGTVQLTATVQPANATNNAVTWTTSSTALATVSGGLVTAKGLGIATITVKTSDGNKTDTVSINVVPSISLDRSSLNLDAGKSAKLVATIGPSTAANKAVTWSSSDQDVAAVYDDGTVLGIKAGPATITATAADGSQTATCSVTVTGSLHHSYSEVVPAANALQAALNVALSSNDSTKAAYCEFVTTPSWLVTIHLNAYKPAGSIYTINGTITAPVNTDYTVGALNGTATLTGGLVSTIVYHDAVFTTPRSGTVDIAFPDGKNGGTVDLATGEYSEK
jgi:uncharacterized protein YjdB